MESSNDSHRPINGQATNIAFFCQESPPNVYLSNCYQYVIPFSSSFIVISISWDPLLFPVIENVYNIFLSISVIPARCFAILNLFKRNFDLFSC